MNYRVKTAYVEVDESGNEKWAGFNILDTINNVLVQVNPDKGDDDILEIKLANYSCSRSQFKEFVNTLIRAEKTMSGDK